MDLNILSRLIKELILTHDRVSLSDMGSFVAELAPSVFSDRAMVIHPPFKRLLFRTSETWNDELLENLYAKEMNVDLKTAKHTIHTFIKDFRDELNNKKSIAIADFGTMRATGQNEYYFVAEKDLFIYPETYGLEPINVKKLAKPGLIEIVENSKGYRPENKSYRQGSKDYKQEIKSHRSDNKSFDPDSSAYNQEGSYKQESKSYKPAKEKSERKKISKGAKRTIVFFVILFLIIGLLALMIVFKDQLRPIWEWLLYSSDERNLLKQIN